MQWSGRDLSDTYLLEGFEQKGFNPYLIVVKFTTKLCQTTVQAVIKEYTDNFKTWKDFLNAKLHI